MADYVAPAGTLSLSWSGKNPHRGAVSRLIVSWGESGQTIAPVGWSAEATGVSALVPQQFVRPSGFDTAALGGTWALTGWFNYRPGQYRVDGTWAGAKPYAQPNGTLNVTFDKTVGYISPNGYDASGVGAARVFGTQFVRPVGFDLSAMGAAGYALFGYQYPPPQWTLTASWVGKARYTPPRATLNGAWTLPIEATIVALTGWADGAIGGARLFNETQFVLPAGVAPGAVPVGSVRNVARSLSPRGLDSLAVANSLTVVNRSRYVAAGNIGAAACGTPSVALFTRYLRQSGILATRYGVARVSHERQNIQLRSIAPPGLGTPWASSSPRIIEATGRDAAAVPSPLVGGTRYLQPAGIDVLGFGTRIIPESQSIAPLGFREDWGQQDIKNHLTFAVPMGFQSTVQEEFRWGRVHVWNRRQFITMTHDAESGLSAQPWSQWTLVENRSRVVRAIGVAPPAWGYTQIDNKARVVRPAGMRPSSPPGTAKAGMVAHRVRQLPVDGIEVPPISTWHVVFNAAKVLAPPGTVATVFGTAALENTRREFDRIGDFDSAAIGTAFVDFAVRSLTIEPRYSIAAPDVRLPEVKLHTRYFEPQGADTAGVGLAALSIHFKRIEPRWNHRDLVGEPHARNVTPELGAYGWNAEKFGDASVRLQWRRVKADGASMQLFGRARIADRKQGIAVPGTNVMKMGDKLVVTKTGTPPYAPQNIEVDIPLASESEVGIPGLNQSVLYAVGVRPPAAGTPLVRFTGATVDAGIKVDAYGKPTVGLRNRRIAVSAWDDANVFSPGKPVMSPLTIWAVKEAPEQAKLNHGGSTLHYVGETDIYPPGVRFGAARISTYQGILRVRTMGDMAAVGAPRIDLRRRYITPKGVRALRMGWANIGDGEQTIAQFGGTDTLAAGRPSVARAPYTGPQSVVPPGIAAMAFGSATWVSLRHRTYQLGGFSAMSMGRSGPDSPYQWRRLHVGPPMPTCPRGFEASQFGETWVSLRVRGVEGQGFSTSSLEYDPSRFAERLRVSRAVAQGRPADQILTPVGVDGPSAGAPNVRPGVHYIRPDGDADQFRKGAF